MVVILETGLKVLKEITRDDFRLAAAANDLLSSQVASHLGKKITEIMSTLKRRNSLITYLATPMVTAPVAIAAVITLAFNLKLNIL